MRQETTLETETIEVFEQQLAAFEEKKKSEGPRGMCQPWPVTLHYIRRGETAQTRELAARSRAGKLPGAPCRIQDAVLVHTAYRK